MRSSTVTLAWYCSGNFFWPKGAMVRCHVNTAWLLLIFRWFIFVGIASCFVHAISLQYKNRKAVEGEDSLYNLTEYVSSRAKMLNVRMNQSIARLLFQICNKVHQLKIPHQSFRSPEIHCLLKCAWQFTWRWAVGIWPACRCHCPPPSCGVQCPHFLPGTS